MEKQTFNFKDVVADSGIIMVCDLSKMNKLYGEKRGKAFVYSETVKNGLYKVKLKIIENGREYSETSGIVEITSGKVTLGDPCYFIPDNSWDSFICDFFEERGAIKKKAIGDSKVVISNKAHNDTANNCIVEFEKID